MSSCRLRMEPTGLRAGRSRMRPFANLLVAAAVSGAFAAPAIAAPEHYAIDPVHTRIAFAIDHLGFSKSLGTFSHPSGSLWLDPDDLASARIDVSIDIASLDLGDADWRDRMLKRDYFDIKKHATARFVSTSVEPTSATTARVHGNLTLRGSTHPVTLDVTLNKHGRHPLTFRTTAGFSATATLQRSDFGMDDNLRTVGDRVDLRIEVEAARKRATDDGSDSDNATTTRQPETTEPA